jgi:hypothetical protein
MRVPRREKSIQDAPCIAMRILWYLDDNRFSNTAHTYAISLVKSEQGALQ